MAYVQRNHLIIETERISDGKVLLTNDIGESFTVSEDYFYDTYTFVRKSRKTRNTNLDDIANAYAEMGELVKQSNGNNEDYIFDTKLKVDKAV